MNSSQSIAKRLAGEAERKILTFSEAPYRSSDGKTIMGEIAFKEILFLDYRDTEAGSNPREYAGLKRTNLNILKSLLKDHINAFRFLHSGIIISLANVKPVDKHSLKYDDSCLTNGNQTRFIILILSLLKMLLGKKNLVEIGESQFTQFLATNFEESEAAWEVLRYLRFGKVKNTLNFLRDNSKYVDSFNKMDLEAFLNSRLRAQVNIIERIVPDLEDNLNEYSAGTMIAEANNDTQNVKVDDIFGNKYKRELEDKVFKEFIIRYRQKVKIEYRIGEVIEKTEKVHILALLRPVVATGIITREKEVFNLTNQRDPIYRLFEKLLRKDDSQKAVEAIAKLIPFLYDLRKNYVDPLLESYQRTLVRECKEKAATGELDDTTIGKDISQAGKDETEVEKIIKRATNYNVEHIMPVLVYRIRNLLVEKPTQRKVRLNIPTGKTAKFIEALVETIYRGYVSMKLRGVQTSLSSAVRHSSFYNLGSEAYTTLINTHNLKGNETDFITSNRYLLS